MAEELVVEPVVQATSPLGGISEREAGALQLWMKTVDGKMDKLILAIEGNGKPGLKQEIVEIKSRLEDLEEWQRTLMAWINRVMTPLGIGFIIFLFTVLWGILTDKIDIVIK